MTWILVLWLGCGVEALEVPMPSRSACYETLDSLVINNQLNSSYVTVAYCMPGVTR